MYKFIKSIGFVLSHMFYRVKINGKENIPEDGAVIVCGNHLHALDAPILIFHIKRKLHFMAKVEVLKGAFLKYITKVFELIPVDRNRTDIEALKKSLKVLKDGEVLGIFPEGTRNGLAKNVEVKSGVAYFALKTNATVVPFGVNGNFKPFSKITYNIGKPIDISNFDVNSKEDLNKATDLIMDNIISLSK